MVSLDPWISHHPADKLYLLHFPMLFSRLRKTTEINSDHCISHAVSLSFALRLHDVVYKTTTWLGELVYFIFYVCIILLKEPYVKSHPIYASRQGEFVCNVVNI